MKISAHKSERAAQMKTNAGGGPERGSEKFALLSPQHVQLKPPLDSMVIVAEG
jgi:hypothetical protein